MTAGEALVAVTMMTAAGTAFAVLAGASRAGIAAWVGWMSTAAAVAVAMSAAVLVWQGSAGAAGTVLVADRVTTSLVLLVCVVSAVVQAFAGRYLAGDRRQRWFVAGAGLLTASSVVLVSASTVVMLAAAWTVAGAALVALLATYPTMPAAHDGIRRAVRVFLIGDLALWTAVAIVVTRWGDLDLRRLGDSPAADDPLLPVAACLIVVAALSRSAQAPMHRWLPASLTAPTPVSALLHAGVVNAGGVLLIRLNPFVGRSSAAMWLAVVAGAVTAVFATTVMLTKPDVKGALAWSTSGQMGFMIMTCGLGLPAVAMVHLLGHALYKATLFLGSGSVVGRHLRHAAAPPAPAASNGQRIGAIVFAVIVPAAALAATSAVWPVSATLAVFAWASAAAAAYGLLQRRLTMPTASATAVALVGVLPAYVWGVHTAYVAWTPANAVGGPTGSPWVVAVAVVALAGVAAARLAGRSGVGRSLYAWTVSAAHPSPPTRSRRHQPFSDLSRAVAWGVQP